MMKVHQDIFSEQKCQEFEARLMNVSKIDEIIQIINDQIEGDLNQLLIASTQLIVEQKIYQKKLPQISIHNLTSLFYFSETQANNQYNCLNFDKNFLKQFAVTCKARKDLFDKLQEDLNSRNSLTKELIEKWKIQLQKEIVNERNETQIPCKKIVKIERLALPPVFLYKHKRSVLSKILTETSSPTVNLHNYQGSRRGNQSFLKIDLTKQYEEFNFSKISNSQSNTKRESQSLQQRNQYQINELRSARIKSDIEADYMSNVISQAIQFSFCNYMKKDHYCQYRK